VRKSKARARLEASRVKFQIEQLETRVLLFIGPISLPFPVSSFAVDSPQASVSSIAPVVIDDGQGEIVARLIGEAGPAVGESVQAQINPFNPAHSESSIQDGSSALSLVNRDAALGYTVVTSSEEGRWQAPPQTSVDSTVTVTSEGTGDPSAPEVGILELAQARYDRLYYLQTGTDALGSMIGENGNGIGPPLSLDGGGIGGLMGSAGGREYVDGMLDAGRPSMPSELSGDVGSAIFAMLAHGPGEPGSTALSNGPADSADGVPFDPGSVMGGGLMMPGQAMNFAPRGAPAAAAHVLIGKISSSTNSPTTESGTTAASSASSNELFVSSLQRQDDQDSASVVTAPAQGSPTVSFASSLDSSFGTVPASLDSPAQKSVETTADNSQSSSNGSAAELTSDDQTAAGSAGGFDWKIPTGPLASRNAGPLGPILASTGGDPTPEVDRDERALYQAIELRESEAGDKQDTLQYLNARAATSDGSPGELGGSVAVVPGAGGFPLNVTALPRNRSTELGGLLSSIRAGSQFGNAREEAAEVAHLIDPAQMPDAARRDDSPAFVVFIKAACGLALGLGMSSRVFFPTLLTGAQNRIRTRLRNFRAKSSRR
jgi:hypothetical protein